MNELKLFENPEFGSVRTIEIDNEPWFVMKDVCSALGLTTKHISDRLDEDEVNQIPLTDSIGREQLTYIVNEPGLYALVLRSDKPKAKGFKRWITHEVVPSIRKHGAYMTADTIKKAMQSPDFIIQLATELKAEQEKNRQLETKIEQDKPKTVFADAVSVSKTSILIGDLAKLIRQNGYEIGQKRLFQWMRDNGYLMKSGSSTNLPTQYSMERGWFEIKETTVTHADGHTTINKTPKVTGKCQIYFINLFLSKIEEPDEVYDDE